MDPNQHVKNYLKYYIEYLKHPRFAVLINGPWGIGKTFLVNEILKTISDKKLKHVYISLYGMTSIDEIDYAILCKIYPPIDSKAVKFGGWVAQNIGKYFRLGLSLKAKYFLNKTSADLFIFDDLERCDLPINKILGYINGFVEHEERKVIIIANEQEIKGREDYGRIREKLIGKTLEVQSVFGQALDVFIESLQDKRVKEFIISKKDTLSEVYSNSGLDNLRILQQTMWDFERFYGALEDKHKNNDPAVTELLGLIFALSFELKAGRLKANDLLDRSYRLMTASMFPVMTASMFPEQKKEEPPPIIAAQKRYPQIRLASTILSDQTLANLLTKGMVDAVQILGDLKASSFFVTVADEPAWQTVWYALRRTEAEFNDAFAKMEAAFTAREFTVTGEILHVFGLRIWLSRIGVLTKNLEEVVAEGKAYIDDLCTQDGLQSSLQDNGRFDIIPREHRGLGFHETSTPEFNELYCYLVDKQQTATENRYPQIADDLLTTMISDPERFHRCICLTNDGTNEFYNKPVLAALDPGRFVEALLAQHPTRQNTILVSLYVRYRDPNGFDQLRTERHWAIDVRNRLHAAAENMCAISKYRIRQNLHDTLDEVLGLGAHAPQTEGTAADQPG